MFFLPPRVYCPKVTAGVPLSFLRGYLHANAPVLVPVVVNTCWLGELPLAVSLLDGSGEVGSIPPPDCD